MQQAELGLQGFHTNIGGKGANLINGIIAHSNVPYLPFGFQVFQHPSHLLGVCQIVDSMRLVEVDIVRFKTLKRGFATRLNVCGREVVSLVGICRLHTLENDAAFGSDNNLFPTDLAFTQGFSQDFFRLSSAVYVGGVK